MYHTQSVFIGKRTTKRWKSRNFKKLLVFLFPIIIHYLTEKQIKKYSIVITYVPLHLKMNNYFSKKLSTNVNIY